MHPDLLKIVHETRGTTIIVEKVGIYTITEYMELWVNFLRGVSFADSTVKAGLEEALATLTEKDENSVV